MYISQLTQLIAALLLLAPAMPGAETTDPSGHWKGTLQAPGQDVAFEIDLARNGSGEFAGAISVPTQKIHGLPLATVVVEGRSIRFHARSDQKANCWATANRSSERCRSRMHLCRSV